MKKAYKKPVMNIVEVETQTMLALSGDAGDTKGNFEFGNAPQRRGEWGNLWSETE